MVRHLLTRVLTYQYGVTIKPETLTGVVNRSALIEPDGDELVVRQPPYVCLFCGFIAENNHRGLGVCNRCMADIERGRGVSRY